MTDSTGAPTTDGAVRAPLVASRPAPEAPLTTLRGGRVDADLATVAGVALVLVVLALIVAAAVLFVAGADKNAQITSLRRHGVPVEVTVTSCLGLLGGSGSNAAGHACTGTYVLGGHRYHQAIPSDALYDVGARLRGVAVPSDPALLSLPSVVAGERASWRVFITPAVLAVLGVGLGLGTLLVRRRRHPRRGTAAAPPAGPA